MVTPTCRRPAALLYALRRDIRVSVVRQYNLRRIGCRLLEMSS